MMYAINPYVAGNPVGNSPAYVGRQDILRELLRVLRRPRDNALVLFGQRRIGKTSILQHLAARLPQEGPFRPVYLDLQDKATWPLDRVLGSLASVISRTLGLESPDLGDDAKDTFRHKWLPKVLDSLGDDESLVLLFDEFDVLANPSSKSAGKEFFPYLRELLAVDLARLQFVFVIGRNVDDLDNIALSLFKATDSKRVSLLAREDTEELVRLSETEGPTLRWSSEAVDRVWQLTHGHPFLTQQLCSHVWESAYDREPEETPRADAEAVDAVLERTLESSQNSLEWLWDGLPPAERVVTSALAEAGPEPISVDDLEARLHEAGVRVVIRDLQNAPAKLREWDILEPSDDALQFRVELLRQWLVSYKPLQRVQEELDHIEPVAQNLYEAASGLYRTQNLEQAIPLLEQAIGLNPNHLGANQLLAEILISQQRLPEARTILERLFEYQPSAARPRLVQVLLRLAETEKNEGRSLKLFEQILGVDPGRSEATKGLQAIWIQRGDRALDAGNLERALEAFENADAYDRSALVKAEIRRVRFENLQQEAEKAEADRRFGRALELTREMAEVFPETREDWASRIQRLENLSQLAQWYREALGALQANNRTEAQRLLLKIIASDPSYEETSRYFHLAVTGRDPDALPSEAKSHLETLEVKNRDLEHRVHTLNSALEESQSKLAATKAELVEVIESHRAVSMNQEEASAALEELKKRYENLKVRFNLLRKENKKKDHRIEDLEEALERKTFVREEALRKDLEAEKRQVHKLQEELDKLQEELDATVRPAEDTDPPIDQNDDDGEVPDSTKLNSSLGRPLRIRNPLDHIKLMFWILIAPKRLQDYRTAHPKGEERLVADWLQSTFLWLPPFLSMIYLGTAGQRWSPAPSGFYFLVAGAIACCWGLWGLYGNGLSSEGTAPTQRKIFRTSTIVTTLGIAIGLALANIEFQTSFVLVSPFLFIWPTGLGAASKEGKPLGLAHLPGRYVWYLAGFWLVFGIVYSTVIVPWLIEDVSPEVGIGSGIALTFFSIPNCLIWFMGAHAMHRRLSRYRGSILGSILLASVPTVVYATLIILWIHEYLPEIF